MIIFTGYSGFIGKKLLDTKLFDNKDVVFCGRRNPGDTKTWIFMDLEGRIPEEIDLKENDTLVHFASKLPNSEDVDYSSVIDNEIKFLNHCHKAGVKEIVYASSGAVYGTSNEATEETLLNPKDDYSLYKVEIENTILKLWPKNCIILRLFFPYGSNQNLPRLIPNLIQKISSNEKILINGNDGIIINPVYIDDAIEAINYLILNKYYGIYNIAGREQINLRDIISMLSDKMDNYPLIDIKEKSESSSIIGSVEKLLNKNSNLLSTSLHQGINNLFVGKNSSNEDVFKFR